jgi:competence protein ComEC
MLLGVVIMVLAALNGLTIWLVKPFEWSIQILNQIIHFIASFEQFIIKDIPFNGLFLIFSYIVIITTILWFKKTHFKQLLFVLVSIISLQSAIILNNWRIAQQSEWIVFHLKKKTLLVQREGNEVYTYSNDSTITENKSLKSYLINHFSQIKKKEPLRHTAYFNGKKILILDSLGIFPKNSKPDIVVLTQTPKVNLDRFLLTVKPKIIIADGSNYQSILKQWQKSCEKQKIPFHATAEKGFFQLN